MKTNLFTFRRSSIAYLRPMAAVALVLSAVATPACEPPIPMKATELSTALVPEWETQLPPKADPAPGDSGSTNPPPGGPDAWSACFKSAAPKAGAKPDDLMEGHQGPTLMGQFRAFYLTNMVASNNLPIKNVRIERGALVGEVRSRNGAKIDVRGAAWAGARLRSVFLCPSGSEINVDARIAAANPMAPSTGGAGHPARNDEAGGHVTEDHDTWLYSVETLGPPPPPGTSQPRWTSLCRTTKTAQAIPMEGVWDEHGAHHEKADMFTLACPDTSVAKCYRQWGYRPWDLASSPRVAELHAACTRMARADYAGDGKSATIEGINVGVWDNANVIPQGALNNPFEAAWTSEGAVCRHHLRCASYAGVSGDIPSCGSAEEAQKLAGFGRALVFNTSSVGQDCSGGDTQ